MNTNDSEIWLCTVEIEDVQSTETICWIWSNTLSCLLRMDIWDGIVYLEKKSDCNTIKPRQYMSQHLKHVSFGSAKISVYVY